jgi:hypothetical protein
VRRGLVERVRKAQRQLRFSKIVTQPLFCESLI